MSWVRPRPAALLALALAALALGAMTPTFAAFASRTESGGNVIKAASDFRAPLVGTAVIGKAQGGTPGYVKPGGEYFVYANVAADTGSPPSGLASVKADVSAITAGSTAVTLVAGSFSAGGVEYGYRSAVLTAGAGIPAGVTAFAITATDVATNAETASRSVTVDSTPPKASDVQAVNGGSTVGLIEQSDVLTLTFSEPVEPASILAGWNGEATNVVVRVLDNGLLALPLGNDAVQIYNAANTTALPLGAVDLGAGDYVAGLLGGNVRYGATGTASKMSMKAGNAAVQIVLGTYGSTIIVDPARGTAAAAGTMTWTPVATPYDRAANAAATTPATETGAADKEF